MTDARLPTRRTVLGELAARGESGRSCPARCSPRRRWRERFHERGLVIVGGGISGLVAALKVADAGRSVLVVEARNRVGGQVLSHRLGNGSVIESGGAFIGPTQDRIEALAKELNAATFKEYVGGQSTYLSQTLGKQRYEGTVPPDPTILPDAAKLQKQIDDVAAEIDVAAP